MKSTILRVALCFAGCITSAIANPVALQQATATLSQSFDSDYSAALAINGTTADDRGWAIAESPFTVSAQTAAFETVSDVGFLGGSIITFTLTQTHSNPGHTLGRFRFSITTDDRGLFADGLSTGGDVTANWIVLNPFSLTSANGTTLSKLGDFSILASGTAPETDTYTISAHTLLTGITGIRLEALEDASLPGGGPGRHPQNGNFVISELQMAITVPEPSSFAVTVLGGLLFAAWRRVRPDGEKA